MALFQLDLKRWIAACSFFLIILLSGINQVSNFRPTTSASGPVSEFSLCIANGISELRIELEVAEFMSEPVNLSNGIEAAFLQFSTNREVTVILSSTSVLVVLEKSNSQENLAEVALDFDPSYFVAKSLHVALVDGSVGSGGVGRIEIVQDGLMVKSENVPNLSVCTVRGGSVTEVRLREGSSLLVGERVPVGEFGIPLIVGNTARGLLVLIACVYIFRLGHRAVSSSKKSRA